MMCEETSRQMSCVKRARNGLSYKTTILWLIEVAKIELVHR